MISSIYKNTVLQCKKCNGEGVLYTTAAYNKYSKLNDVVMCSCTKEMFRQIRLERSGVPKKFWFLPDLSTKEQDLLDFISKECTSVYLVQQEGEGKSVYAAKLLGLWFAQFNFIGVDLISCAQWISLYSIAEMTNNYDKKLAELATSMWGRDILVLDEAVPQAFNKHFGDEDLYFRLKSRIENNKKTIITSLITPDTAKKYSYFKPILSGLLLSEFEVIFIDKFRSKNE